MASITGTSVRHGAPVFDQYSSGATTTDQVNSNIIVKIRFGSGSTVNQTTGTPDGSSGLVDGGQIDMGVPTKPNNWYRLFAQTCTDDNDGSVSGMGFRIERWTPSSGWQEVLAQGSHSSYDNNYSDWYRQNQGIFWVPTHPSYQSQQHQFRLGFNKHDNGQIRFNCSIGNDLRRNGWENNIFEIWEVDGDRIATTGAMSRF